MRKIIGFSAAALLMTAASIIGLPGATTAAYADWNGYSCSGTGCNGLDPTYSYNPSTGAECSDGAYTNMSRNVFGGVLELRWGPDCQVNWTRFTPGNNDLYGIIVENVNNGPWVGYGIYNWDTFSNGKGVAHWTDEVYAPDPQPAGSCVQDYTTNQYYCMTQ